MIEQLILIDKKRAFSKLPSIIRNDDLCYLLSKDYISYLNFNNIIPDGCKVLNLASIFNREIEILRGEYLNLFANLSKKYDSIEWWRTHIASRNSASIPLQLNITYLFCAKKIIDNNINYQNQKKLIFIADNQALLNSIAILGKNRNLNIFQPGKIINKIAFYFKLIFLYMGRICFFALSCYRIRKLAFSLLKTISIDHSLNRKGILIRSWFTKDTLNDTDVFKDRNFGILPNWLKSKGYKVTILPMFFNLDGSIKELFKDLNNHNINILIQECYLKIVDYVRAIIMGWKELNIPLNNIKLDGVDLTHLFHEIQLEQGFNNSTLSLNLCFPLLKRLKEKNMTIDAFYYPLENNVPEKIFIIGCKKYFPHSEIIGYQHSVWMKNQLGMFFGRGETKYHPIADKIICNGSFFLEILKDAGFPENRIFSGPNLRFTSVHKSASTKIQYMKRPNLMLVLTFDNDLAYDLIHKVNSLSNNFKNLFFYIRRHPDLDYNKLEEFLKLIEMTNYQYADNGRIQDWLKFTDIVISSCGSVTILETVAMNVPLIRVVPDNNFLLDPLAWSDYPIKPVNNSEDIKNCVSSILEMSKVDKDRLKAIGSKVLSNYFKKINEDNLQVFC